MELNLPQSAWVNKFIAKTKFYEKATLSAKLQDEFIKKIQKITWQYKLSEATIGISKTDNVTEIQVFTLELKEQIIPKNVLKVIDKAIPYQILYQFVYKGSVAYGITLKGSILKAIAGQENAPQNYYFSDWDEAIDFDFTGINLEKVYQKLIKTFIGKEANKQGDFEAVIATDNTLKSLEKDIIALSNKIKRERQFNRKVELNKMLLEKQQELKNIKGNI